MSKYQEVIDQMEADLKGYHITIQTYPSGGTVEAQGCEECGTSEDIYEHSMWRKDRGKCNTIDDAVLELRDRLTNPQHIAG